MQTKIFRCFFVALLLLSTSVNATVEKIFVQEEIDDDHIIIVRESGEQLLLEKWSMRLSPPSFEGKSFVAEVSANWITIHFEGRDSIKWSVEKSLGYISQHRKNGSSPQNNLTKNQCYKTFIQDPSPFLGNGGEVIVLGDGTIWKEVSYQYLYLYEYSPSVTVCPADGNMILGENVFQIIPLR